MSDPAGEAPDTRAEILAGRSSPSAHWRRRNKSTPLSTGDAARQGSITSRAFQLLGRDGAIAFLNTENEALGGRPITIATQSEAGDAAVRAELDAQILREQAESQSG